MTCPHCGKTIAEDSVFCEHCGQKVEKTVAPKKKSNWLLWVILCLILCAGGTAAVIYATQQNNKKVTTETVDDDEEEYTEEDYIEDLISAFEQACEDGDLEDVVEIGDLLEEYIDDGTLTYDQLMRLADAYDTMEQTYGDIFSE